MPCAPFGHSRFRRARGRDPSAFGHGRKEQLRDLYYPAILTRRCRHGAKRRARLDHREEFSVVAPSDADEKVRGGGFEQAWLDAHPDAVAPVGTLLQLSLYGATG